MVKILSNIKLPFFIIIFLSTSIQAQGELIGDSILILENCIIRPCSIQKDTFYLRKQNDSNLINKTWYFDKFYSTLNDSISYLFDYGIEKAFINFTKKWSINAHGIGYGFGGSYRISRDHRILIKIAGSVAMYYKRDTLNLEYQRFWRSIVPLIHESKYKICGDSLILYFQTGIAILRDSSKVTDKYINLKKWPSKTEDKEDVDDFIDSIMKVKK